MHMYIIINVYRQYIILETRYPSNFWRNLFDFVAYQLNTHFLLLRLNQNFCKTFFEFLKLLIYSNIALLTTTVLTFSHTGKIASVHNSSPPASRLYNCTKRWTNTMNGASLSARSTVFHSTAFY